MRIRQIKPSWFTDLDLQTRVSAGTREFYIGLWMLADDDGYFEWEPNAIGVQLYGYMPLGRRQREIAKHSALLVELSPDKPHLRLLPCGHAQVPKMPEHQRIGDAKRVTTFHRQHMKCPVPAAPRGFPRLPASPRDVTERGKSNGTELVNARERDEEPTEFRLRVARPS